VNDEGVPNDDMPNFIRPAARDGLPFSDAALAALLAGTEPPEPMPGLQPVADVLAALRSGPTGDELAGEASVLAEFRRSAGVVAHTPARHRPRRVTSLAGARAAVAAAVAALSLGGLATAAYAGILPAPVQRLAHDTIGAPAAPSGSPARTHLPRNRAPVLGVTGPTAHRLCAAYTFAKTHGTAAQRAAAFHNLVGAAGGAGKVAAFCGTAVHPGRSGEHSGGKGASHGNHGKGASNGNHGKGSSNGNHGKSASNGNQGNGSSAGNQAKGASDGNHSKGASQGNQGQGVPPGHQNGHHVSNSKGKSSAHGGNRGKHGAPYASRMGAHRTLHATERSPRARR